MLSPHLYASALLPSALEDAAAAAAAPAAAAAASAASLSVSRIENVWMPSEEITAPALHNEMIYQRSK